MYLINESHRDPSAYGRAYMRLMQHGEQHFLFIPNKMVDHQIMYIESIRRISDKFIQLGVTKHAKSMANLLFVLDFIHAKIQYNQTRFCIWKFILVDIKNAPNVQYRNTNRYQSVLCAQPNLICFSVMFFLELCS